MQFGAHIEQAPIGDAQSAARGVVGREAQAVGELGERQRVEQLDVAQTAAPALDVGLAAVRDLAGPHPTLFGVLDQLWQPARGILAPLLADLPDRQVGQVLVASDVTGVESSPRNAADRSSPRHAKCLGHRPHAVVRSHVGIPNRIPELVGHRLDTLDLVAVTKQHQIEVGYGSISPRAKPPTANNAETAAGVTPRVRRRRSTRVRKVAECPTQRCCVGRQRLSGARRGSPMRAARALARSAPGWWPVLRSCFASPRPLVPAAPT